MYKRQGSCVGGSFSAKQLKGAGPMKRQDDDDISSSLSINIRSVNFNIIFQDFSR